MEEVDSREEERALGGWWKGKEGGVGESRLTWAARKVGKAR